MEWLNLHTSVLDSPEVIGADPEHRATWLMLLRYCIGQENSGVIHSCRTWKDRKWQQIVRVTQAETQALSDLWTWHGDDLHITHYPLEKEAIVKGGRRGGKARTQAKTQASRENGMSGGRRKTQAQPQGKTQQKGREGNGKEGNGSSSGDETNPSEQAITLCETHPSRDKSQPALRAALGAIGRHGFATVLEGVRGYADQVAGWTPSERAQFVKNAPEFFGDDLWNKPAENFRGRKQGHPNGQKPTRTIDIGGRKPSFDLWNQLEAEKTA